MRRKYSDFPIITCIILSEKKQTKPDTGKI